MIKKCWITDWSGGNDARRFLGTLTFESDLPNELSVDNTKFPEIPTEKHPLRHTIAIGIMDTDDLWEIYGTIQQKLCELGEI